MSINDSIISSIIQEQVFTTDGTHMSFNIWMYIAIIEFVVIGFLFVSSKFREKNITQNKFRDEALSQDVDFNNIINSSFNAQALYDSLKVKCHPDRFADDEAKFDIANSIFQEITKNKNNIKRLEELKKEAIINLKIKL
ncbi:hypothetical protein MASR1M31_25660 [Porphyromonadaceae bacterium]